MPPILTATIPSGKMELPAIPDPVGFAGSYAGVSNGALLVAGGANFPDNIGPWGKSPKTWYDKIFVLEKPDGSWREAGKLPRAMGYGVSLTTPEGVLCIGGADGQQHYRDVFLLTYQNHATQIRPLASLPRPLANACGAILDHTVFVAGGIENPVDTTAETVFLSLNLQEPNARWRQLPAWPGPGRMLAVAGSLNGQFYLVSGTAIHRNLLTGSVQREYLRDAYAYHPATASWQKLPDVPHSVVAAPSPAHATREGNLLIIGGDDGANADKVPQLKEKHPGFRSDLILYNPRLQNWKVAGQLPVSKKPDAAQNPASSVWAPVTTPLVQWGKRLVLPGGEVRPGVRTNRVLNIDNAKF